MKIKFKDLPLCLCGHPEISHPRYYEYDFCEMCANEGKRMSEYEHDFKQDNLKYLEMLYNKRKNDL